MEYFVKCTPVIKGLMDDENEAEWIVDVTVQADRQGRAMEYAEAWQASAQKKETDELLEALISSSDETLGRWLRLFWMDPSRPVPDRQLKLVENMLTK